jgi:hypothetical protein
MTDIRQQLQATRAELALDAVPVREYAMPELLRRV